MYYICILYTVYSGSVLWNQLPDNLKSVDSLDVFKILVRKHIASTSNQSFN